MSAVNLVRKGHPSPLASSIVASSLESGSTTFMPIYHRRDGAYDLGGALELPPVPNRESG